MKKLNIIDLAGVLSILLLVGITISGLLSFSTDHGYVITNQYGNEVRLFGSGVYAHDSYFKAPIFIGSDATMLILVVPMMILALINEIRNRTIKSRLTLSAVTAVVLYYAASMAFGATYNSCLLLYISLFSCSLFSLIALISGLDTLALQDATHWELPSKGIRIFLIFSGISLFIAWLPDIIPTILAKTTLPLIEVYTTEITYVLDMGILSPLMFICLMLLKKKDGLGIVILSIILTLCAVIGVMLPIQTAFQMAAGIDVPIPMLITKVGIFILLAVFAAYFNLKLLKSIRPDLPRNTPGHPGTHAPAQAPKPQAVLPGQTTQLARDQARIEGISRPDCIHHRNINGSGLPSTLPGQQSRPILSPFQPNHGNPFQQPSQGIFQLVGPCHGQCLRHIRKKEIHHREQIPKPVIPGTGGIPVRIETDRHTVRLRQPNQHGQFGTKVVHQVIAADMEMP